MEKKIYELTVVMNDKKTESEVKSLVESVLDKADGRLVEFTFWGKKDLVRPIKKAGTVVMGYSEIELAAAKVVDLTNRLRMNDDVMRHLLIEGSKLKAKKAGVSAKAKKFAKVAVKKTAEAKAKAEAKAEVKETKVTNKKAK